jgi:hypothetical protein
MKGSKQRQWRDYCDQIAGAVDVDHLESFLILSQLGNRENEGSNHIRKSLGLIDRD